MSIIIYTNTRNDNGDADGPVLCQNIHGMMGEEVSGTKSTENQTLGEDTLMTFL